ncbi:INCE protein, partial [Climacteris rufus]|nr:INCE protein [Climacteris rufus]
IKDFIKRNTPTRPNPKVHCMPGEKERQRLENLRKKQEAEEQRRRKVEEEKRRRQAEMKQKREERLRKALQARERLEQMEEEKKKKRMEQKILQNDEKVHISQVREEKVVEERSKRKTSKKHGEAEARKQKTLKGVRATWVFPARVFLFVLQEENEQQEPLQRKREDEVKERGKKVLELKNLLEQQQAEQAKDRWELVPVLQQGIGHWHGEAGNVNVMLELGSGAAQSLGCRSRGLCSAAAGGGEKTHPTSSPRDVAEQSRQGEPSGGPCLPSLSTSCLGPPQGAQGSPPGGTNDYGLDLNSDDSTDDESDPRKPVPAWADGAQLHQAILHQYYHPVDLDALFGAIPSPKLEHIFYKSKPRYFKRTSSAVWHSPP